MDDTDLMEASLRWHGLIKRSGATCGASASFDVMSALYREKHRKYHTLHHVVDCLKKLDEVHGHIENKLALEFAIWFHDVIYEVDTKAKVSNEKKSADFAKQWCEKFLSQKFAKKVELLVLATEHSKVRGNQSNDEKLIVDIDLSSLGAAPEIFERNNENIRKEYAHLTDEEFKKESVKILQRFLFLRPIFQTKQFYDEYESKARKNLKDQIANLKYIQHS